MDEKYLEEGDACFVICRAEYEKGLKWLQQHRCGPGATIVYHFLVTSLGLRPSVHCTCGDSLDLGGDEW